MPHSHQYSLFTIHLDASFASNGSLNRNARLSHSIQMNHPMVIRAARDTDAADLITLIGACFSEYPGCVLDVDGEMPELRAIATFFENAHGRFWIAEDDDGHVVGSIGVVPSAADTVELRKLYVARHARRNGLGGRL